MIWLFVLLSIGTLGAQPPGVREAILKYQGAHTVLISSDSFPGSIPISAGIEGRFKEIHAIDLHMKEHTFSILKYRDFPLISLYYHDSAPLLIAIMASLQEPALIWLDGFWRDELKVDGQRVSGSSSLMRELLSIGKHPIKNHTLLIGDVDQLPLFDVKEAILRINPNYRFSLEDEGRILVAQ